MKPLLISKSKLPLINLYAVCCSLRNNIYLSNIMLSPKTWDYLRDINNSQPSLQLGGALKLGFPCGSAGKEFACNAGDLGSVPVLGRSLGEGKGYPLQYSGLKNSMDYTVHGIAKSWTRLSEFHSLSLIWSLMCFSLKVELISLEHSISKRRIRGSIFLPTWQNWLSVLITHSLQITLCGGTSMT